LGVRAHRGDDLDTARILLARALVLDPVHEQAWIWLARSVRTNGERRKCLEHAWKACPQNATIRDMLAEAHTAYRVDKAVQRLHHDATPPPQGYVRTSASGRRAFVWAFLSVVGGGLLLLGAYASGITITIHWP
jgi:hypothetical protein